MRTKILFIKKAFPILVSALFIVLLSSCGAHNNGYTDGDGIYTSKDAVTTTEADNEADKTNYYKQYFKSKNGNYADLPEEGAIFTDIEAYSTVDSMDEDGYIVTEEVEYSEDYGAWGSNSDNVTVNIYNTGGYGYGSWHRPYWNYGWGYYSNYWYNPYWGFSYGWGYPYYSSYYCSPYGGYYSPYYGHGYGYGNSVAYNRGRRNLDYLNGRTAGRNRYATGRDGRSAYARSETTRRSNRSAVNSQRTRPNSNSRPSATRPRGNSRPSATRPSTTRPRNPSATRPKSRPATRPASRPASRPTTRPSNPSNRGGGAVRSSGGSRSSGSSTRSSGGRRGGGRN